MPVVTTQRYRVRSSFPRFSGVVSARKTVSGSFSCRRRRISRPSAQLGFEWCIQLWTSRLIHLEAAQCLRMSPQQFHLTVHIGPRITAQPGSIVGNSKNTAGTTIDNPLQGLTVILGGFTPARKPLQQMIAKDLQNGRSLEMLVV